MVEIPVQIKDLHREPRREPTYKNNIGYSSGEIYFKCCYFGPCVGLLPFLEKEGMDRLRRDVSIVFPEVDSYRGSIGVGEGDLGKFDANKG